MSEARTLYRPVGPKEFELVRDSGWLRFPPRLPDQPIFYPVVTEEYARKIARDWNVPASGAGFVTRFQVRADFLEKYEEQCVGAPEHREYWIPAEELTAFNENIVGRIEVIAEYRRGEWVTTYDLAKDRETIELVQQATLTTKDFGLVPDVALFGSPEWWRAVHDGRIPTHEVHGVISRVYMSGHGDWPMFELDSEGTKSTWTSVGERAPYVVGRDAIVEYVLQRLRKDPAGLGETMEQVVRVRVRVA